jgi:hypothetical protein
MDAKVDADLTGGKSVFSRIEIELQKQRRTKAWLAGELTQSTQNINNWKQRGVPASKITAVAETLGVSREYIEGTEAGPIKEDCINYTIFLNPINTATEKLLEKHLKHDGELCYVFTTSWRSDGAFVELCLWVGKGIPPQRLHIALHCIIGVAEYSASLNPDIPIVS